MRRSAATLVVFALLTVVMAGRWAAAQERGAAPGAPSAATQEAWNFNDEASESWGEILRPQALNLALLGGFFALAFTSFFRKSVKLKYVTLVIAVGYMGFVKSHLISIVDIFGPIRGHLPIFKYNLAWYLLAVVVVLSNRAMGAAISRPHVRLRGAHSTPGRSRSGPAPHQAAIADRAALGADEVRRPGRNGPLFSQDP